MGSSGDAHERLCSKSRFNFILFFPPCGVISHLWRIRVRPLTSQLLKLTFYFPPNGLLCSGIRTIGLETLNLITCSLPGRLMLYQQQLNFWTKPPVPVPFAGGRGQRKQIHSDRCIWRQSTLKKQKQNCLLQSKVINAGKTKSSGTDTLMHHNQQ